jgi:hypothetical protein
MTCVCCGCLLCLCLVCGCGPCREEKKKKKNKKNKKKHKIGGRVREVGAVVPVGKRRRKKSKIPHTTSCELEGVAI